MAGTKNHDFHILPPDLVPLMTTIGAFTFTTGMVLNMHDMAGGKVVPWLGLPVARTTIITFSIRTICR